MENRNWDETSVYVGEGRRLDDKKEAVFGGFKRDRWRDDQSPVPGRTGSRYWILPVITAFGATNKHTRSPDIRPGIFLGPQPPNPNSIMKTNKNKQAAVRRRREFLKPDA